MNKRAVILFLATAGTVLAVACGDDDEAVAPIVVSKIVNFTATLTPAGELGANVQSTGSGTFTATLDTSTNVFTYTATYTGLTSNVSLGHIHGPFILGGTANTAAAILNFDPAASGAAPNAVFGGLRSATSGTATGTITLTATTTITPTINGDSLKKLLLAGNTYVNIHTTTYGGGEVRGQISRK
jgi:hypothetical protein